MLVWRVRTGGKHLSRQLYSGGLRFQAQIVQTEASLLDSTSLTRSHDAQATSARVDSVQDSCAAGEGL
jgi:hypothetical protein